MRDEWALTVKLTMRTWPISCERSGYWASQVYKLLYKLYSPYNASICSSINACMHIPTSWFVAIDGKNPVSSNNINMCYISCEYRYIYIYIEPFGHKSGQWPTMEYIICIYSCISCWHSSLNQEKQSSPKKNMFIPESVNSWKITSHKNVLLGTFIWGWFGIAFMFS